MADRYWVGGSGTWNFINTTNWSDTPGGAGGFSPPTISDDVFFTPGVFGTCTVSGGVACRNFNCVGPDTALAGNGTIILAGFVAFQDAVASSFNGTLDVQGSATLYSVNSPNLACSININSASSVRTLITDFSTTGTVGLVSGTLDTGGYNLTCGLFSASGSATRSLVLGTTTFTVTSTSSAALNIATVTNLSITGNYQINLSGATSGISSGGFTFYNVAFTSINAGTKTITGINTFNNFAVTAPSSAGVATVTFAAQQTINGTLSTTGTAGNRRVFFTTANYGISQDLVVNSAPSLTDADFRGLYVRGTAAPISGTRIGNRGECRGITFDAPKTVYWNLSGTQNWSANGWATTSTGTPSTDNFPLPQDTATFTNAGAAGTVSTDAAVQFLPTINLSGRTSAMTFSSATAGNIVYGSLTFGSGVTISGTSILTFSGGTTQTITSAGKTFTCPITIDTYGGTVQLADALNIGSRTLAVTNGTFTTAGYAVTANTLFSTNSNVRTINLGASTLTLATANFINFGTSTNLTFNAGTSQINGTGSGSISFAGGSQTFYNVAYTSTGSSNTFIINGANTFNNLTITAPASAAIASLSFSANQTINGTLTCAGASAVRRIFLRSNTPGTPRTLTVNAISADDCDFRDINLAGTASGASPTRAGDCGGNTGSTFPAPKTVYWNLAGAQNWSATAWAPGSGGTPDINNFPLAQDTAVFDEAAGSVTGTITINAAWNIGTFDASLRTSAMTLTTSTNVPVVYGDWLFGTGITSSSTTGTINFSKNGTQTITSNGVQFGCPVTINHPLANVQLADALSLGATRTLTLTTGTFDAVTYNVTTGLFNPSGTAFRVIKMGAGTWTITGTGVVWRVQNNTNLTFFASIATIVLTDTSAANRTFDGGTLYYNKLTIGGTTGTSTLTIIGNNTFGELASTKTVAHTIAFGTGTQTFGAWTVTGTAGNVVTITGTSTTNVIAGPAVTGVDYLAMGSWGISTTSPGEFYAGANSTGTAAAPVFRTAAPAPRTLYWVGGTGAWSATSDWSLSSGGAGGEPIPTSLDAVNFDSLSNATAYTVTVSGVTLARCASFTMAGPLVGNVTFAGSVGIAFHGNVSFAATGITRTYTGAMQWAGSSSYTFTTNGVALTSSNVDLNGVGSTWTLGSSLTCQFIRLVNGTFNTSTSSYSVNTPGVTAEAIAKSSITMNGSTFSISGSGIAPLRISSRNVTFDAGTGQINFTSSTSGISTTVPVSFNNVSFTNAGGAATATITGVNTFNTLSFAGRTSVGITSVAFGANQTISTLTLNAGTASAFRTFLASDTIGTPRTLTVGTLTAGAADIDFRDITIAGAAAPISGTRFGDAKGNSGITFDAAKTVYWALAASNNNWGTTGSGSWSATNGGSAAADQFPLAQDTAFIPFARPNNNAVIPVNASYNIGTIDMNERNGSALVTLGTSTNTPAIYGNWINGTGTTLSGTGVMTFAGRGSQTITSAGRMFTQRFAINTPSGSVTLQDAFTANNTTSNVLNLTTGTFDANGYAATFSSTAAVSQVATAFGGILPKTLAIGSSTWTLAGFGTPWNISGSNLTVTGTGTISLTNATTKIFQGGSVSYSGITLNQGGAGALTITDNNTFKDITNTYSATGAATINLGATTQTLTNPWTATGEAGRVLTVSGTSAASPGTLRFTGAGQAANVDYLAINNVRAYDLTDTWYAGANSTNGGSLGWYFIAGGGTVYAVFITESASGVDAILASTPAVVYDSDVSESASGVDAVLSLGVLGSAVIESASGVDAVSALAALSSAIAESTSGTDVTSALASLGSAISEAASGVDNQTAIATLLSGIAEAASAIDATAGGAVFTPIILESASGIDEVLASAQFGNAVAETASGIDTAFALASLGSAISESAQALDATAAQASLSSVANELAQALDQASAQADFNSTASDSAQALDQADAKAVFLSDAQEYAQVDDLPSAQVDVLSAVDETAQIDDASSAVVDFSSAVSEDGQALDTVNASADLNAAASEDAQALDDVSAQADLLADASESVQALDTTDAQMDMFPSVDEAAQGNDSTSATAEFGVLVSEDGQALDDVTAVAAFGSEASETASALDQASALANMGSAVSEDARVSDASSGAASFGGEVSETNNVSDSSSASGVLQVSVSDTAQVSDENASQVVFSSSLSETFQALDQASSTASFASRASETASAQDQVSVDASIFGASTNDTANASDVINSQAVFPGSIDETVASSDSALAAQLFVTTLLESSQTLDSVSASQRFASRVSETATALDQVAVDASVFGASTAETVRASDQASSLVTVFGSISETATGRDTTVGFLVFPTSVSEAAQVSDQIVGQVLFRASLSEQVNASDTSSSQAVTSANTSEAAAASDQAVVGPSVFGAATAETGQVADQPQSQAELGGLIAEAATEADNASGALVLPGSTTEAAQIIDESSSSQAFAVDTAETVSAADNLQTSTVLQSVASESAQPSDQSLAVLAFGGTVVEEVGALDQVQTQAEFGSLINETAMSADSTVAAMIALGNVAETAQVIEAFLSNQTFPVSTNEAVSAADVLQALATFQTAVNETVQASDQTSTVVVFVGSVAEQVGVSDLAIVAASIFNAALQDEARVRDTVNAPGSVYNPAVADTAQAQDDASSAVVISRTASETISASDENNAAFTAASQINESATAEDVAAALAAFVARTEESASASDVNLVAPSIFNAIALASAQVADNADAPGSVFNVSMTESVTLLDSLIGGFLWNLINDSQDANWQNVVVPGGTLWTLVDSTNNPNWQQEPPP
jgi:hypothetical protein